MAAKKRLPKKKLKNKAGWATPKEFGMLVVERNKSIVSYLAKWPCLMSQIKHHIQNCLIQIKIQKVQLI
jgi:hypothetical protein